MSRRSSPAATTAPRAIWHVELGDLVAAACHPAPRNFTWEEWSRFGKGPYRPTCKEAPIPPDVVDAIHAQATAEVQAGNLVTATAMLDQLNGWLHANGQFRSFGVDTGTFLEEVLAK